MGPKRYRQAPDSACRIKVLRLLTAMTMNTM
jgi:hypothetical protein